MATTAETDATTDALPSAAALLDSSTAFRDRVTAHAEALLAVGERSPGTAGAAAADDYVAKILNEAGISKQATFPTPVTTFPVQGESWLRLIDQPDANMVVAPHVQMGGMPAGTSAAGLTAPLVRLHADLHSEQSLDGAIVIVPASHPTLWLRAAELGAVAIVFENASLIDRHVLEEQATTASLPLPRVVTATAVPEEWEGQNASLRCFAPPKLINARNRVGYMPPNKGSTEETADAIVLAATYEGAGWILAMILQRRRHGTLQFLLAMAEEAASTPRQVGVVVHFYAGQRERAKGLRELQAILANKHKKRS